MKNLWAQKSPDNLENKTLTSVQHYILNYNVFRFCTSASSVFS